MSFPYHDPAWMTVAEFVRRHHAAGETVLAPDAFMWQFDSIHRYANTRLRPEACYDWAIIHSWMLHHLDGAFLDRLGAGMRAVYGNEVFVVWARARSLPRLSRFDRGVARFRRNLKNLRRKDGSYATGPEYAGPELMLPDSGTIFRFRSVPRSALRGVYDRFFESGGYQFNTKRDAAYTRDLDRRTREFLGDTAGLDILDIACGEGRVARLFDDCRTFVGVDLAEVPVRTCRRRFAGRPECQFAVMDAEALALPDARFDVVTMVDASEHIADIDAALAEVARVIRPGGLFIVTSQNKDSLHLIVNRKLGYPEFLTNNQHFREFNVAELTAAIGAHGFAVERSAGVVLYPYWEIPGVDEHMRKITDDDAEFAEIMSVLGERAGAEYAYTFMLAARKAG